jgi:signal peptidase II
VSGAVQDAGLNDASTDPIWRHYALLVAIAIVVVAVDQVTKWLVVHNLGGDTTVSLFGGAVTLEYARNTGAAFSLFRADGIPLAIIAIGVSAGILVYYRRASGAPVLVRVALGLILGGAIGNLVDRIRLGYVVDFVDLHWWPVFNIADSCIVIGVVLLILQSALGAGDEATGG